MPVLLMGLGLLIVALGFWQAQQSAGDRRRRRGRAPALENRPSIPDETAAAALDPSDPRSSAWAVLQEPVQTEPGLWDQIAERPPLRQFRLGILVGFGLGLVVVSGLWAVWPVNSPPEAGPTDVASPGPGMQAAPETGRSEVGGGADTSGSHPTGSNAGADVDTPADPGSPEQAPGESNAGQAGTAGPQEAVESEPGPEEVAGEQPAGSDGALALVTVEVEPGMTAPQVAARLQSQGLIADEQAFLIRLTERGLDTLLQPGTFTIPTNATLDEVIDLLTGGV